jgi:hypothetical protein
MTQKLPLPITLAMTTRANENEAKPRYYTPADWTGGVYGNDQDVATASTPVVSRASAAAGTVYVPRAQLEKSALATPLRPILDDLGIDYGVYAGAAGRTGTVQPRQPYPSVKP